MNKQYNHLEHEDKIYDLWEKNNAFKPNKEGIPFTIIMPPPNANDSLHVGHAMFVTIEDIIVRYQRMKGRSVLWLPGTDHAGIETQFVFEKKLRKEGKSRFQFDRNSLYKMIWDYVQENSDVAVKQLKKIGASADWGRFKFMLDEDVVKIVLETFLQLNDDGLIYRSEKLVNYCTKCGTAFSELEVYHEERQDKLYFVKYKIAEGEGDLIVATTRPETIYADTAIAIHPTHPKVSYLSNKKVINPLTGEELPIVLDEAVDPDFGTGALKITPFHDLVDFEIWERHKNEMSLPTTIIGYDGKLSEEAQEFAGLKAHIAKPKVVEKLNEEGFMEKIENYNHSVGICYRCSTTIEPLPMSQFFVKVKPLTQRVLEGLDVSEISIYGAGYDKILRHWLENLKDWNISRQIVWGIRMPVWYKINSKLKNKTSKINVKFIDKNKLVKSGDIESMLKLHKIVEIKQGLQTIQASRDCEYIISIDDPGDEFIQETDTFDTWFSSAQWPFTTLMTNQPGDLERYYPTQVMETGYDILPFWVMRMLMMGYYKTKKMWGDGNEKTPFEKVYLHGLVRDENGKKMSKSKGNVINPLSVIDKYGADALRMALVMSSAAGKDSSTGETKIRGMRNLTNKIWNAARFIILKSTEVKSDEVINAEFENKLSQIVDEISNHLENLRIGLAAELTYNYFWHWYCDEMIELAKLGKVDNKTMIEGLVVFLKLLHPFIPFVTEAVYQTMIDEKLIVSPTPLIISPWPNNK